jgi:hypothetical protein
LNAGLKGLGGDYGVIAARVVEPAEDFELFRGGFINAAVGLGERAIGQAGLVLPPVKGRRAGGSKIGEEAGAGDNGSRLERAAHVEVAGGD